MVILGRWHPCRLYTYYHRENIRRVNVKEMHSKSCGEFIRRREHYNGDPKTEYYKDLQEHLQKRESNRLSKRLKRNWYYVIALIIAIIMAAHCAMEFLSPCCCACSYIYLLCLIMTFLKQEIIHLS